MFSWEITAIDDVTCYLKLWFVQTLLKSIYFSRVCFWNIRKKCINILLSYVYLFFCMGCNVDVCS